MRVCLVNVCRWNLVVRYTSYVPRGIKQANSADITPHNTGTTTHAAGLTFAVSSGVLGLGRVVMGVVARLAPLPSLPMAAAAAAAGEGGEGCAVEAPGSTSRHAWGRLGRRMAPAATGKTHHSP